MAIPSELVRVVHEHRIVPFIACPVRKGAPGDLPTRVGKAPDAYLTR
jgi:hypothetical protein